MTRVCYPLCKKKGEGIKRTDVSVHLCKKKHRKNKSDNETGYPQGQMGMGLDWIGQDDTSRKISL